MEGVSQLADCLFGLKLRVEPIQPGEVWHPTVLKVGVYSKMHTLGSELDRPIGTVYCDLLDRPGKPAQVSQIIFIIPSTLNGFCPLVLLIIS